MMYLVYAALLIGLAIPTGLFFLYKASIRGKLIVELVYRDRTRRRFAVRKDEEGILKADGHCFLYDEKYITYTRAFLTRETVPFLSYVVSYVQPQNPYNREMPVEDEVVKEVVKEIEEPLEALNPFVRGPSLTTSETETTFLSNLLDERDLAQFGEAQNSNITNTQILRVVIGGLVALGLILLTAGWFFLSPLLAEV